MMNGGPLFGLPRSSRRLQILLGFFFILTTVLIIYSSRTEYAAGLRWPAGLHRGKDGRHVYKQLPRLQMDMLVNPQRTFLRKFNSTSRDFPDYKYSHTLARGYEGEADVYVSTRTREPVVIKTFFATTRTCELPDPIKQHLQQRLNVSETRWPVEIPATIRNYTSEQFPESREQSFNMVHALDAFYVPPPDPLPEGYPANYPLPWRMVVPLYGSGSLDGTIAALKMLNLTAAEIDFLYRPRFRSILAALARMHTTQIPQQGIAGFCHDDVKSDNIFNANSRHELMLADMGQVRSLKHPFHANWTDCRTADAQRAWKTYLFLLREGSVRDGGFDARFGANDAPWARAYSRWIEDLELPESMVTRPDSFWNAPPPPPRSENGTETLLFPVLSRSGRLSRVALGRDEALRETDRIRVLVEGVKKQLKMLGASKTAAVRYPKWWWTVPEHAKNELVEFELKVIDGALIYGMLRPDDRWYKDREARKNGQQQSQPQRREQGQRRRRR